MQRGTAELAKELETYSPPLTDEERRFNRTIVRLLGEGEPLATERLADALGQREPDVAATLAELPGIYRDGRGRVVGFGGLSVIEMPHRLDVDGRQLYAWCAWDTLFLPLVLDERAKVSSACPTTGEPITLTASPEGLSDVTPSDAVVSFLLPGEQGFSGDVIRSFCHFVNFFASEEAAETWIAEHEGTFQLSIEDAFELARFWAARAFGADLEPEADPSG